jgi:hypothetical protein
MHILIQKFTRRRITMKATTFLLNTFFLASQTFAEGSKAFVLPRPNAVLEKQLAVRGETGPIAEGSKAFVLPRSNAVLEKQLAVRGGAGPIDSTMAAKCICSLWLAQGVVGSLAPELNLKAYIGNTDALAANPLNQMMMRRIGLSVLSYGVLAFSYVFKDYSVNTAFALTSVIWGAEWLYTLLNNLSAKGQAPGKEGEIIGLALASACLYGCLTDADWALTAIKFLTGYAGLAGLTCSFLGPNNASKFWAVGELDNLGKALIGSVGANLFTLFIVAYTTAWEGGTIETAIGRACLAGLFFITKFLFITKEVELLGPDRNTTPIYFWAAISAAGAYSILA